MKKENIKWIILIIISLVIIAFSILLIINNGKNSNQVKGTTSNNNNNNNFSFEEKKAIIDDLNEKFEKFRKSDNCYVCLTAEDDDTITIMRAYKYNGMYKDENELYIDDKYIDSKNGNKILFTQSENIEIDNYRYYYVKNNLTNEIEKEKSLLKDDSIEIGLFYNNYISPTQLDLEYFSSDKIEEKINDFIKNVRIEINNNEVKFTLKGSNNEFFGATSDYDIKEVTIDYNTGYPISYILTSKSKTYKQIYEYKTDTVTEDDFDISKYDGVEVTE